MTQESYSSWPNFSEKEGEIVKAVLLSNKVNYWTGKQGRQFEKIFASTMRCDYAIALANGTLAIDLALYALGVGAGDEVVVTPRSFMASASTVQNCGARPVFADVDSVSQNITAESIEAVLSENTKAIICVHLAGWPCDMHAINELAKNNGVAVIEDCAQAHGAKLDGVPVGALSDIGAWSFCQDKIMTTGGEGGMITTNNTDLFESMWAFKDHGKSRQKMEAPSKNRSFKYVHDSFGTNFRMTEMQAALGEFQLGRLDEWKAQRTRSADFYTQGLADLSAVRVTRPPENVEHAFYKYYFFLNTEAVKASWGRDRIVNEVNDRGGQCFSGCCPELYREGAFLSAYGELPTLPMAHKIGTESLMLNVHPGIGVEFLTYNLDVLTKVLRQACR